MRTIGPTLVNKLLPGCHEVVAARAVTREVRSGYVWGIEVLLLPACGIPLAKVGEEFLPLCRGSQESLGESLAYIKQSTREWLGILNVIKGVSHKSRSVIVTA